MSTSFAETKLKTLRKDLTSLLAEYEALEDEVRKVTDPSIRVKHKIRIKELDLEIPELERKIEDAEKSSPDPIVNERAWKSKLPEIDFKDAVDTYKAVLAKMERDCGAALFLMQDGTASAASLCVERMISELKRSLGRRMTPGFPEDKPTPKGLMLKLAEYLGKLPSSGPWLPDTQNAGEMAAAVVKKLVGSLGRGSLVWLDVELENAAITTELLGWFLQSFWKPLVQQLPDRAKDALYAQVFGVFVCEVPLPTGSLKPEWVCRPDTYKPEQVVEIPLAPAWKPVEISGWLSLYTHAPRCPWLDIDAKAQNIYDKCRQGVPDMVLWQIQEFLTRLRPATC